MYGENIGETWNAQKEVISLGFFSHVKNHAFYIFSLLFLFSFLWYNVFISFSDSRRTKLCNQNENGHSTINFFLSKIFYFIYNLM